MKDDNDWDYMGTIEMERNRLILEVFWKQNSWALVFNFKWVVKKGIKDDSNLGLGQLDIREYHLLRIRNDK